MPPRPEPGRPQVRPSNRPAFAGRFFITLLFLGLSLATGGISLAQVDEAAAQWSATEGKTPLMSAAKQGDAATVARLIAGGADVNASNAGGATALMFAALSGDPMVTSLLVRAGAKTDVKAKLGWTALALAAVKGYTEVAEVLLDAGADQGVLDAYGWTPLMRAVDRKRIDFVRLLLESPGADLTVRQEDGATALHIAAASGDLDIVRLLVAQGADLSAGDRNGNTAAVIARSAGYPAIAGYLEAIEND